MTDDSNDLRGIRRETTPPDRTVDAIAKRLRREGLLRRRLPRRVWLLAAAIAMILVATPFIVNHEQKTPQPRYILLLYEPAGFAGGSRAEYAHWAHQMSPLVVGGEELSNDVVMASSPTRSNEHLTGYFLIDARDDATAERVARNCPHLRHGGVVVLRRIVL